MVQHKCSGEQPCCWLTWTLGVEPWMGRLRLPGNLRQRPLRLRGCIYRYIRSPKRESNHGTLRTSLLPAKNFLALIRECGTEFANQYNPCLLDRYSVDIGWDTGHPNSHVFSMLYFRWAGASSHRSLRDKVWHRSHLLLPLKRMF